jgi:Ca-activated chloride channel family protein
MNFYEILGIPRNATTQDVRRAYRRAAQRLHPDINVRPGDTEQFMQANEAYEVLSDPKKRAQYDAHLETIVDNGISQTRIEIKLQHGRDSLILLEEPQMHYMLLDILPPKKATSQRTPINLCILIDRSTSMRGERMDHVRGATMSIIKSLDSKDSVSIVAFSDRAEIILSPEDARKTNVARAQLTRMHASGGTEIARALQLGLSQVRSRISPGSVNHLILITDGRTYGDEEKCIKLANEAASNKTPINTVGIGSDWNDELLDEIARISGGGTVYMDSLHALNELMDRIHHSLSNVAARQVLLRADQAKQATLRSAFRMRPDPLPLGDGFPMSLGHLPSDDKISVLLEWMIDPLLEPTELLIAEYSVSCWEVGREQEAPQLTIADRLPINHQPDPGPPDEDVLAAVGVLTLYRMQERAHSEAMSGNVKKAISRLENLAKQLQMMGENRLADLARSEIHNLKQTSQFSRDGEKELKYGTRALLLTPPSVKR